jgi:hypothetical protein
MRREYHSVPTEQLLRMRQGTLMVRSRTITERNLEGEYETFSEEGLNRIVDDFDIQHARPEEVNYFSEERIRYDVAQRILTRRQEPAF